MGNPPTGIMSSPIGAIASMDHDSRMTERKKNRNSFCSRIGMKSLAIHFGVFLLSTYLADPLLDCVTDIDHLLRERIEEARNFFNSKPIDFSSEEIFRSSRNEWHAQFSQLVAHSELRYVSFVNDVGYSGTCSTVYPVVFVALDALLFTCLILLIGFFIYQDLNTSFGAPGLFIRVGTHATVDIFIVLAVLNFPVVGLMNQGVELSRMLEENLVQLRALQRRSIEMGYDMDRYHLYANIWDGYRFGVREPIIGEPIDKIFYTWFLLNMKFVVFCFVLVDVYFLYRLNARSLSLWRKAIPSVVCIGVMFPNSADPNKIYRVGSGCIIDSKRGLILTNWHLFQRLGDTLVDEEQERSSFFQRNSIGKKEFYPDSLLRQSSSLYSSTSINSMNVSESGMLYPTQQNIRESSDESLSNSHNGSSSSSNNGFIGVASPEISYSNFGFFQQQQLEPIVVRNQTNESLSNTNYLGNQPTKAERHKHLLNPTKYSESFHDLYPDMKIVIGLTSRSHPRWMYTAKRLNPSVESPSAEFAPLGLDLEVIRIDQRAIFQDANVGDNHSYTFSSVEYEDIHQMSQEHLVPFVIADPWKEIVGDSKIKVLGYPAPSFTLSVLTGYFTGISYDHPAKLRGSWLNLNVMLPNGGSGGAAVNGKGELLGIGTQTRGEMTNIRSIHEAKPLIIRAKAIVDEERKILESTLSSGDDCFSFCPVASAAIKKTI